jgi:hypothetical protein
MTKYSQGEWKPNNPAKYIGKYPITYRSSWELSVFRVLDAHPSGQAKVFQVRINIH